MSVFIVGRKLQPRETGVNMGEWRPIWSWGREAGGGREIGQGLKGILSSLEVRGL